MISALDFRHALSAATFLMEDVDWETGRCTEEDRSRFKCYETSMVVSYARPFSTARGMAAPFSWKQLGGVFAMSAEENSLHEMLIDARKRTYAHSDGDHSDITASIWRSDLGNGRTFDFRSVEGGELLLFDQAQLQAIQTFHWNVRHHVDKAVQHHPGPRDAGSRRSRQLLNTRWAFDTHPGSGRCSALGDSATSIKIVEVARMLFGGISATIPTWIRNDLPRPAIAPQIMSSALQTDQQTNFPIGYLLAPTAAKPRSPWLKTRHPS